MFSTTLVIFAASVALGQCGRGTLNPRSPATMSGGGLKAVAVLISSSGSSVKGTIFFRQMPDQMFTVSGSISGLNLGEHGFHVHEFGDITDGCTSMGAHFNPGNETHGAPDADVRHVGDLGNIEGDDDGNASINVHDNLITLHRGLTNIIGRGLVVHEKVDDLGQLEMRKASRPEMPVDDWHVA